MEKCLLTHWCNYLSWINICSQAWVPSPLQHVPVPRGSAGYVYLCLFPNTVYLGTSCSNFSLWHPPPIQHLCIYVNILAAVIENTNVVTPPDQFFQFKHDTAAPLFLDAIIVQITWASQSRRRGELQSIYNYITRQYPFIGCCDC